MCKGVKGVILSNRVFEYRVVIKAKRDGFYLGVRVHSFMRDGGKCWSMSELYGTIESRSSREAVMKASRQVYG